MQSKPRRGLAEEMNRRRAQLRLTWEQVATRAGISIATLRRLRNSDDPVSIDTMIGIDSALEWKPGYTEARLNGARAAPAAKDDNRAEREDLLRQLHELRAKTQQIMDQIDALDGDDTETPAAS